MRGLRPALTLLALALAQTGTPAAAKRSAPPAFAEPGDIIAAEGNFTHLNAAKGAKAAIHATAAPDAQIFAPQLMRVSQLAAPNVVTPWHTRQVWMSCDGSIAVTHGEWQQSPAVGWYIAVWKRQKGGSYRWVLEEGGALTAAPPESDMPESDMPESDMPESDMISASVADCPVRRARSAAVQPSAPNHGKAPPSDYTSGHADDATLEWATTVTPDGSRTFALLIKQDSSLREVLRATAAPPGG